MKIAILALLLVSVAAHQQYCWCKCNNNSLLRPIDKCGLCTKDFCLQEDADLCAIEDEVPRPGSPSEGKPEKSQGQRRAAYESLAELINVKKLVSFSKPSARDYARQLDQRLVPSPEQDIILHCFQIESFKESVIVYSFMGIVTLLLGNVLYRWFAA